MKLLQEIIIPNDSVNDESVMIMTLDYNDGDFIQKGDTIIEFETSKAVSTIEAEYDGYIFYNFKEGDQVLIGEIVAEIYDEAKRIERIKVVQEDFINTKILKPIIKTSFSNKAKLLLAENYITENAFDGRDFINSKDVMVFIDKRTNDQSNIRVTSENKISSKCSNTLKTMNFNTLSGNTVKERIVIACPSLIGMEVILDIINGQEDKEIVGYIVDDKYKATFDLNFLDCNVFDFPEKINKDTYDTVVIALAGSLKSMLFRKKVYSHYLKKGINFTNLISSKANIANNVRMGLGNIIGSGVYIGTGSCIGNNNFISYMTTIGHHNMIGDNNLFAPGVIMSGLVEVGEDCILTTGVNFIDKVKIGNRVILPLGYNVISNLPDDTVIKMKNEAI